MAKELPKVKGLPNLVSDSSNGTVHGNNGRNFPACGGNYNMAKPFVHTDKAVNCNRGKCKTLQIPATTEAAKEAPVDLAHAVAAVKDHYPVDASYSAPSAYRATLTYGDQTIVIDGIEAPDHEAATDIVRASVQVSVTQTRETTWSVRL